jgi:hypothetical protein
MSILDNEGHDHAGLCNAQRKGPSVYGTNYEKLLAIKCAKLETQNEKLRAALQRIDGINDNPACFNLMIEEVLRDVRDW